MTARFTGKDVLVTGGSTGIRLAIAKRFAEEGAHVSNTGRRQTDPLEIVETALILASPPASFSAGAELFVDGGTAQV